MSRVKIFPNQNDQKRFTVTNPRVITNIRLLEPLFRSIKLLSDQEIEPI